MTHSQIPFCDNRVVTSIVGVQRKVIEIWNKVSPPNHPEAGANCSSISSPTPAFSVGLGSLPCESSQGSVCPLVPSQKRWLSGFIVQWTGPGNNLLKAIVMSSFRPLPFWLSLYDVQLGCWDFEEPYRWFTSSKSCRSILQCAWLWLPLAAGPSALFSQSNMNTESKVSE